MHATSIRISRIHFLVLATIVVFLCAAASSAQTASAPKNYAQKLVADTMAAHPDLHGLEIDATPPSKTTCVTIASDKPGDVGVKCDPDEVALIKGGKLIVEKDQENGKDIWVVTLPLQDANGTAIAGVAVELLAGPDQTDASSTEKAHQIAKEMGAKIASRQKLFEPMS